MIRIRPTTPMTAKVIPPEATPDATNAAIPNIPATTTKTLPARVIQ